MDQNPYESPRGLPQTKRRKVNWHALVTMIAWPLVVGGAFAVGFGLLALWSTENSSAFPDDSAIRITDWILLIQVGFWVVLLAGLVWTVSRSIANRSASRGAN